MNTSFTPPTTLAAFQASEFKLNTDALNQLRNLYNIRWSAFWNQPISGTMNTPEGPQPFRGQVAAEQAAVAPEQKLAAWGTNAVANLALFASLGTLITELEAQNTTLYPTPGSDIPTYPPGYNIVQNSDGTASLEKLVGTGWTKVVAAPLT